MLLTRKRTVWLVVTALLTAAAAQRTPADEPASPGTGPAGPTGKPRTFDAEEYVLIDPRILGDEEPAPAAGKVQVVVGKEQLFVVTPDGALYGMGVNWFGQLGLAELIKRDLTMILPGGVRHVVGEEHTLIVMRDGSLWGMGRNPVGAARARRGRAARALSGQERVADTVAGRAPRRSESGGLRCLRGGTGSRLGNRPPPQASKHRTGAGSNRKDF